MGMSGGNKKKVIIIGAGLSGCLASNTLDKNKWDVEVYDSSDGSGGPLAHHKAIMRLREKAIGDAFGLSLRKITVWKGIYFRGEFYDRYMPNVNNLYSKKVLGYVGERSLGALGKVDRYTFPAGATIVPAGKVFYSYKLIAVEPGRLIFQTPEGEKEVFYDFCISTIPLVVLAPLCGFACSPEEIRARPIYLARCGLKIPSDVFQTFYVPEEKYKIYRASVDGDRLIFEAVAPLGPEDVYAEITELTEELFGLGKEIDCDSFTFHKQDLGKIIENREVSNAAVWWFTDKFKIYSLGRFALWRPLRMDQVFKDMRIITKMISLTGTAEAYDRRKRVWA